MSVGQVVHTIVFDAGRTLVRIVPSFRAVLERGCRAAGVELDEGVLRDREELARLWSAHDDDWHRAGRPSPHAGDSALEAEFWTSLYRRVLDACGVDGKLEAAAEAVHEAFLEPGTFAAYPDAVEALEELAERGVRLGLLSNWGHGLRAILREQDLERHFDAIVVSAEERLVKPDPGVFHRALHLLGVEPGPDVAYVGDDLRHDIEPSRALGMTAVLVDRREQHPDHDGPRVTTLTELVEVLPLRPGARR